MHSAVGIAFLLHVHWRVARDTWSDLAHETCTVTERRGAALTCPRTLRLRKSFLGETQGGISPSQLRLRCACRQATISQLFRAAACSVLRSGQEPTPLRKCSDHCAAPPAFPQPP